MKSQKIMQNPIARKLYDYKFNQASSMLMGNVKEAKQNCREYAKLAVQNFEISTQVPSPIRGRIPLFSKSGMNILKFVIYNFFTKDTPEEKQYKKLVQEHKIKTENLNVYR